MNFKKHVRRDGAQVNASSMADIAFLLLIFFLVTTTIMIDKGIAVKLPPLGDDQPFVKIPDRNVLRVLVNGNNELLVEGQPAFIRDLKATTIEFITNPNQLKTLPKKPNVAVISLQNDRSTSYATYIAVYNELKAAYNKVWNDVAQEQFGFYYKDLTIKQKKAIQNDYPLFISEAEPTDLISQK